MREIALLFQLVRNRAARARKRERRIGVHADLLEDSFRERVDEVTPNELWVTPDESLQDIVIGIGQLPELLRKQFVPIASHVSCVLGSLAPRDSFSVDRDSGGG